MDRKSGLWNLFLCRRYWISQYKYNAILLNKPSVQTYLNVTSRYLPKQPEKFEMKTVRRTA